MRLPNDLRAFIELLNARGVKYVILPISVAQADRRISPTPKSYNAGRD